MARKTNMCFLVALLVAALLKSSSAQTTHVVGDTTGWTVPASGASAYTTWAATQTFNVGDILVFNFTTGAHDAAEVTKAEFDACSSANPISLQTTSPANVTINSSGAHYFICTFPGHCSLGQKLAINVTSSGPSPAPQPAAPSPAPTTTPTSAPAPQPSSPTPTSAPAPQPSSPTPTSAPTPQPSSPTPTASPSPIGTPPSTSVPSAPSPAGTGGGAGTPPPSSTPNNYATSLGATCLTLLSIALAILY